MKRQEFLSWCRVVVRVPGMQGPSRLALHLAAMDRIVDGLVVCSTTVIAQKGWHRSVLWLTSGGLNRCGSRPIREARSEEISRSCEALSAKWRQKSCGIQRFLIPHIQFIDRAMDIPWSNARWKTRLCLSKWSCRKFQRFRHWCGQRTVEQIVRVPVPTVQEQLFVPEIPGAQVVERIQEHIVESFDQEELDQLRNDWLIWRNSSLKKMRTDDVSVSRERKM